MDCPVCGNQIPAGSSYCPFCETKIRRIFPGRKAGSILRTVNIKDDMPDSETALFRLRSALHGARADGVKVLKIVHGYGSSGRGGELRHTVREYLSGQKYAQQFKSYISGEEFSGGYTQARALCARYPSLKKDHDYKHPNKGITLIVIL